VFVTLDKDFGELGVLRSFPHCGILRLVNFRAAQQGRACLQILESHAEDFARGAIVTAEPGRIRIRQP
jgi:predicted nuclease of predicted toxin-antitoxin system